MTCRHANADHLKPGECLVRVDSQGFERPVAITFEQFRCLDCGAWLSLGPSDESWPAAVSIEIRAAELAGGDVANYDQWEWSGWNGDEYYIDGGTGHGKRIHGGDPRWEAGYLANAIEQHEEES